MCAWEGAQQYLSHQKPLFFVHQADFFIAKTDLHNLCTLADKAPKWAK
jgi:hypothetical protein